MKLGKKQTLVVVKKTDFGVYLTDVELKDKEDRKTEEEVLLPKNQLETEVEPGEELTVFLYKDSEDRLIATKIEPYIELDQIKKLKVKETTKIGAFLDWGLPKDLLLPFKEQKQRVSEGDEVMVTMYIDNSGRLCATTYIYDKLSLRTPYSKDDSVTAIIYEINPKYGAYAAVDGKYSALLPKKELHRDVKIGEVIEARVLEVKEDGKMDLSLRGKSYLQMDEDGELIFKKLEKERGFLPFHDKSDAEVIKKEFGMSKASFKRAIGRLFKERKILIKEDGIEINNR